MLPRVSAALAQFISPIAASRGQEPLVRQKEERAFQQFKPPPEKEKPPQDENENLAQVIPLSPPKSQDAKPPSGASVTQAVLQLMSVLQQQRASLMRWLGGRTYQGMSRGQRKTAKFRKGTILDHKAE